MNLQRLYKFMSNLEREFGKPLEIFGKNRVALILEIFIDPPYAKYARPC